MKLRLPIRLVAIALLVAAPAFAQSDVLDLDLLWRRGQFEIARELINANLTTGNRSLGFLAKAAPCAEAMHDYELAAELFDSYARLLADDPAAYREARRHHWANAWTATAEDPQAPWIAVARAEVKQRLADTGLRASTDRRLALELEYLLDLIITGAIRPGDELRTGFPDSELVLSAAKDAADTLATESDDSRRLELITEFLADYPANYWRHFVRRYELYTAWHLRDLDRLEAVAAEYLAENPDEPLSLGAVSRYYLEADLDLTSGLDLARRSTELSEADLGINGSTASLERLHASTVDSPAQPDYLPPAQRGRFLEYLGSRYNLARYLIVNGDYQAARGLVEPIIELNPFTTEEEFTLAPFLLIAGQAAEGRADFAGAYYHYLAAAVSGDARNRYASQAQQRLDELEPELSANDIAAAWAAAEPPALAGMPLPRFTDVSAELGLTGARGQRLAWGDVDNDGDPDLLLNGCRLYRNDLDTSLASNRFTNASKVWGLTTGGSSGAFADIDNDGDLDFYMTSHQAQGDRLLRNDIINRSGTLAMRFVDITAVAGGPADASPSEGAAWLDADADGFIDLYVANYEEPLATAGNYGQGTSDQFYLNVGGTRFATPEASATGLTPPAGTAFASRGGICAADFDNDRDQDLFVGNYRLQENFLWRNSGAARFTNSARLVGAAGNSVDGWWGHTVGAAWGDIDNDGDLDLFNANVAHPRYAYISDKSQLLINEHGLLGTVFTDRRSAFGIRFEETHACPVFFDANNDGWLDLFITSMYDGRRSFLYLNDGQGQFHDVTYLAGARVLDGFGAAWADYDGDGDLDLAVARSDDSVVLLRNDTAQGVWLKVSCSGAQQAGAIKDDSLSNRAGIGTRVEITGGGVRQLREIQSTSGSGCGNELVAHFGLGAIPAPLQLTVTFPSGRQVSQTITELNKLVTIQEETTPVPAAPDSTSPLGEEEPGAIEDQQSESADELRGADALGRVGGTGRGER